MADRERILRYYKGTEGEETAIRLVDLAEQAAKSRKFRLSEFLDPYGQEIAETVAANYDGLELSFSGGYEGAERQRAMLCHEDFRGRPSFEIAAVKASWDSEHYRLSHRDVLGALLGLGIERGALGDLLVEAGAAHILADKKMAQFLLTDFVQAGAAKASCEEEELSALRPREERTKEIRATVASLRVDSIAAAGFGFSRSRAATDIAADKLKLNWQTVRNASQLVKEGDVLSMRGRGRLEVAEVRGQTKKGRVGVLLRRYY